MNEDKIEELEGKTLIVTHMKEEEFHEETLEELDNLEEDKEIPSKKAFQDPAELSKIFTERRQEMIKELKNNPPESISQLAENLGRGKSEVHSDLNILEKHGIVFFEKEGNAKKPRIPYSEIKVEFNLLEENNRAREGVEAQALNTMKEEKIPETCCEENCERDAENFHDLEIPVGDGEYEKIDETDLDGVADEKFDVVK